MTAGLSSARSLAELFRLPAVLSVPGDALAGAALARAPRGARLALASALLYEAGMALNDYADRERDAVERPARPIPSGRVSPRVALALAGWLTAGGLAAAAALGGRRALTVAAPLAATVWAYDLALKASAAGPATMAAARSLDVLLGASGGERLRDALPAAGVVGAHTLAITLVSRREVEGAGPGLAAGAAAATAAVSVGAAAVVARRAAAQPAARTAALALVGAHALSLGRAEAAAVGHPEPAALQRIVGTGVVGLIPLQAALALASGRVGPALAVAGAWPLSRRLAARTSVT